MRPFRERRSPPTPPARRMPRTRSSVSDVRRCRPCRPPSRGERIAAPARGRRRWHARTRSRRPLAPSLKDDRAESTDHDAARQGERNRDSSATAAYYGLTSKVCSCGPSSSTHSRCHRSPRAPRHRSPSGEVARRSPTTLPCYRRVVGHRDENQVLSSNAMLDLRSSFSSTSQPLTRRETAGPRLRAVTGAASVRRSCCSRARFEVELGASARVERLELALVTRSSRCSASSARNWRFEPEARPRPRALRHESRRTPTQPRRRPRPARRRAQDPGPTEGLGRPCGRGQKVRHHSGDVRPPHDDAEVRAASFCRHGARCSRSRLRRRHRRRSWSRGYRYRSSSAASSARGRHYPWPLEVVDVIERRSALESP